ncbi:hypothetical protein GOEFS_121_00010, partial [Gordonia effusa NBRC 100432]
MGDRRKHRGGGYRWLSSAPSSWSGTDPDALGLTDPASGDMGDLLAGALHDWRGEGYLNYHRYQLFAAMHRERVLELETRALQDFRSGAVARKAFVDCASQIGMALGVSQGRAEGMLQEAVDLMTRLPRVAERMRDGVIDRDIAAKLIERTDLIIDESDGSDESDGGAPEAAVAQSGTPSALEEVDSAIAAELDRGAGAWSIHLARDMADRIVFRQHPDAVRARREAAKADRRVWTSNQGDDMGLIAATMTGERVRLSIESVRALAKSVCPNDPRTVSQRNSDAVFALLNQVAFECGCDGAQTCTATISKVDSADDIALVPVKTKVVVHVVADKATVDGRERNPGFVEGHGVISGDHVQDLIDEPTTIISPLGPDNALATFIEALDRDASYDLAPNSLPLNRPTLNGTVPECNSPTDTDTSLTDTDTSPAVDAAETHGAQRIIRTAQMRQSAGENSDGEYESAENSCAENQRAENECAENQDVENECAESFGGTTPSASTTRHRVTQQIVLPSTQPSNPYRPSTSLDMFVRIRDCYTLIPGNTHSAF